ncbi:ATP-binding protein [Deltaproteobacteria bacterium TL4]
MLIKTRFKVSILFTFSVLLLIGLMKFIQFNEINSVLKKGDLVGEVVQSAFELNLITYEYLLNPAKRPRIQWNLRHDSLSTLIGKLQFKTDAELQLLDKIRRNHDEMKTIFPMLVEILENQKREEQQTFKSRVLLEQFSGLMLIKSQNVVTGAEQLNRINRQEVITLQQNSSWIILSMVLFIALIITANLFSIGRSIIQPIQKLRDGAKIVGDGDLDHRLAVTTKNELGELSRAFDQMTQNLATITVSRDKLTEEIHERKSMEEQLRQTKHELMALNEQLQQEIIEYKRVEAERDRMEVQIRQSQKMEAIGTLASGIAHDFNNLLTPILGYAQLVQTKLDPDSKEVQYLMHVSESATRAKDLVKKILLISDPSLKHTEAVQLEKLVDEVLTVLQASVSPNISIHREIDPELSPIYADPSLIHQAVLNLCTNAIEAMGQEGELRIKLKELQHHRIHPNQEDSTEAFLCLSIQDNGCGMTDQTLERIYEPFFSTKERGGERGTGLGLSIVDSIVKQHGGHIEIESVPEMGTTFRVYFPAVIPAEELFSSTEPEFFGKGHILLVDDESLVNMMGTNVLENSGYQVTSFTNSLKAWETFNANPAAFQLLITDYSMPQLTGPQLMERIKFLRPDIPMILVTGYSNLVTQENLQEWRCDDIIAKPYKINTLRQSVKKVLEKSKK